MRNAVLPIVALLLQFAFGPLSVAAKDEPCKSISGPFRSRVVPGPDCASPVGICTLGILEGNFHATYEFTMLTLVPADPANPSLFIYTGVSVITSRGGQRLFSVDTGIMDLSDPENVPFETTANITGGTGQYVSGRIIATGTLNLFTGEATGTHSGEICKEKKNKP